MRKYDLILLLLILTLSHCHIVTFAQNVGLDILAPLGKLHIKGTADISQFIIDGNATQGNTSPLIRLRKSDGTDLMWIHSDHTDNTFIGLNSGRVNNASGGAIYNTFIGSRTGYSNTTGYTNTANGADALYSNTTGYYNTAIGGNALYSNTTSCRTTAIGTGALFNQSYNPGYTWQSYNVAVGAFALYLNQPTSVGNGVQNTAVGASALYNNTTGLDNTGIGTNTLNSNTTASRNVAIGNLALFSQSFSNINTTWLSGNVAVGYQALYLNQPTSTTNGVYNTAIGTYALRTNDTGVYNTAIGESALYSNSTGNYNSATGSEALLSNISGSENTANGYKALRNNNTGNYNTAVGNKALHNNTTGTKNIAIGNDALVTNTTGSNNTAVGYNAGVISNNLINATAIGYNAKVDTSNAFVLGGTGVDAVRVGIGTQKPKAKLDINGDMILRTAINSTGWLHVGGADSIIVQEGIGGISAAIGTASNHAFRLNSNGLGRLTILSDGRIIVGTNNEGSYGKFTVHTPNNSDGIVHRSDAGILLKTVVGDVSAGFGTFSNHIMRIYSNGIAAINIDNAGNIAMGTPDPLVGYKLSVNGNIKAKELVIETVGWPDYVFDKDFELNSLKELESFIQVHHHLPNIPSAREIEENGVAVGEMQKKMMEKIEELTLYIIELDKEIQMLKQANK